MKLEITIQTKEGKEILKKKYAKLKLMLMRFGGNVMRVSEEPLVMVLEHKTLSRVNMDNPFIENIKAGIEKSLDVTLKKIGLDYKDYKTEYVK